VEVVLPVKPFTPKRGVEYFVELSFRLRQATPLLKAGHEIAWDQFKLPDFTPIVAPDLKKFPALELAGNNNGVRITGRDFEITIDQMNGLTSWRAHGVELIRTPLRPSFWRALTDNDRGRHAEKSQGYWRKADAGLVARSFSAVQKADCIEASLGWFLPDAGQADWAMTYKIYGNGDVLVTADFKPSETNHPPMPRLGMQMTLPGGFNRVTWLGHGAQETYSDRKDARVGIYRGTVDEQFYPDYVKPGETGNKTDTRWIAFTNKKGAGLLAIGRQAVTEQHGYIPDTIDAISSFT